MRQMKKILLMLVVFCFAGGLCSAQENDISLANRLFFKELDHLAFEGFGDLDFWSKQSKYIAFRSAAHLTSAALAINSDRDHGADRAMKFKQIVEMNKVMAKWAQNYGFEGYGDTDYWSKRTKRFATSLAMHSANVAGLCDGVMIKAVKGKLETLIKASQYAAFEGYGDVDYWSKRCKELATKVVGILGEINTELAVIMEK